VKRVPEPRVPIDGFTLLEVLAATLIFAMVVTVLIGSSGEAIHQIGVTTTRLEAGELADRELALLEALLNSQQPLPEDKEEERDDFLIRVVSRPALEDLEDGASAGNNSLLALGSGGGASGGSAPVGLSTILNLHAPGIDAFLLRYDITVEWLDEIRPAEVRRITYAFDWDGARAALPDLFEAASGTEGSDSSNPLENAPSDLLEQLPGAL